MSARRPYVRPMKGWWRKNPWFIEYMIHEGTALFVAAYAFVLLASLMALGDGEAAWNRWLDLLMLPIFIVAHMVILVAFLYHTWTWFNIMPRTLPPIIVNGTRVTAATITRTGLAVAAISSALVFAIACWIAT